MDPEAAQRDARNAALEELSGLAGYEGIHGATLDRGLSEKAALQRLSILSQPLVPEESTLFVIPALVVLPWLRATTLRRVWHETSPLLWSMCPQSLRLVLAVLGEESLAGLEKLAMHLELPESGFEALGAWWLAPIAASQWQAPAWTWVKAHTEAALVGLVYTALAGDDAGPSQAALRSLTRERGAEEPRRVARERWGGAAEDALVELLRPVTPPPFARRMPKAYADLPPVRWSSGEPLDAVEMQTLGRILAQGLPAPHPTVAFVREACDAASLSALCRSLFTAWVDGGMATQNDWIAYAWVLFGGDEAARDLGRLARTWARARPSHERRAARHAAGLFGRIATPAAVSELAALASSARDEQARQIATEQLARIAFERGVEVQDLATTAPDLEMLTLDYGARTFRTSLDAQLSPVLIEVIEGGRDSTLLDLPRPTKRDDAERAKAAKHAWKEFKQTVNDAVAVEIARLERAMVDELVFTSASFRALLERPIAAALARRVIWRALGSDAFRVTEDGSFANSVDAPVELPRDPEVVVVHPWVLRKTERAAWARILADYRIIQPFQQLERALFGRETSPVGWSLHAGAIVTLASRRWVLLRSSTAFGLERHMPKATLRMDFTPGFEPELAHEAGLQRVERFAISGQPTDVEMSEALRDLSSSASPRS
jgi:hypothetical protein